MFCKLRSRAHRYPKLILPPLRTNALSIIRAGKYLAQAATCPRLGSCKHEAVYIQSLRLEHLSVVAAADVSCWTVAITQTTGG